MNMMSKKSNKDKENKKMIKNAKAAKKNKVIALSDMDQPFVTSPQIDKLSVVVDMTDQVLHGQVVHGLLALTEQNDPGFSKLKGIGHYPVSIMIHCPDTNGVFHPDNPGVWVMATKKDYPKPQVRLEFNPVKLFGPMNALPIDKIHEPILEHLNVEFTALFGMDFFDFLHHARVTRLDVCRHVLFRSPEDYLFRVRYARTSQSMFGSDGMLETLYFGKGAGNQTCIYNKARHLNGKKAEDDTVRVETRLKPKNLKILGLWDLENPFRHVQVYSMKADNPPVGAAHWIAFKDSCRFRGIGNALKLQPLKERYALKKMLSELPVPWWSLSDAEWEQFWHEALEDAWLNRIPDQAPPLTMKNAAGDQ